MHLRELYEDLFVEHDGLVQRIEEQEKQGHEVEAFTRKRYNHLCKVLGLPSIYVVTERDALFDRWDEQWAAGITPDLEETG